VRAQHCGAVHSGASPTAGSGNVLYPNAGSVALLAWYVNPGSNQWKPLDDATLLDDFR
jgi:hypothetical protein